MRIHNKLDELLNQSSKIKILRFLYWENEEHTGRGIAKAIGMSPSATYGTLQEMKEEGLLAVRRKGNAILYKIRGKNYVVKKLLKPLFQKEMALYEDMITFIKKNILKERREILSMAIYGSVARQDETAGSDIDLLVVTKKKTGKTKVNRIVEGLGPIMAGEFGTTLSPYILTKEELKQKHAQKQPLIQAILSTNRLIYGEPIERILA